MKHSIGLIVAAALLFGLQAGATFADNPPKLDMTTTCDAAAQFAIMGGRDKEACLDENVPHKVPLTKAGRNTTRPTKPSAWGP